jgi:polysaccharide export outer membrane protein
MTSSLGARRSFVWALVAATCLTPVAAQQSPANARNSSPSASNTPALPEVPADYVVGPEDVLTIVFWREKDLSGDVVVRPDGRITLPLLNEIQAAGLTTEQLRVRVVETANKYLEGPTVTVAVKQINSRKIFITGEIAKPGSYPLGGPTTVMQLIALAGGLNEYASAKNISITRVENGQQVSRKFNYDEFKRGKNLQQNILLKPGDIIVVP